MAAPAAGAKRLDEAEDEPAAVARVWHHQTADVLLDGGADPTVGMPSAVDTARMFGLDDLVALFKGR